MTESVNTFAVEIKTPKTYEIAQAMFPGLATIPFENVRGHFIGMTGELRGMTIPPTYLEDNNVRVKVVDTIAIKQLTNQ